MSSRSESRAAADLHVHSRFSNRPTEWLLRRLKAPECYTDPQVVYRRCRERGMTLVTLTDHDTIDGALEIAHLPGTFVSCEVTVHFPEDGRAFHCLVYGIGEEQHSDIQRLSENVYELRDYLYDQRIAHSVAHLLYGVDGTLRLEHVEKLLVLFKGFEGLNGEHDARASTLLRAVLNNLTPRQMDELANRHDLDPRDREPWRKHLTAGSDDHCGLYVGSAWSSLRADGAVTPGRFLEALRSGDLTLEGAAGSSAKLGRGLHSIAARYARERIAARYARERMAASHRSQVSSDDGAMPMLGWIANGIVRAGSVNGEECATPASCVAPAANGAPLPGFPCFVSDAVRVELAAPASGAGATAETASFRLAARIGQRLALEGLWRGAMALRAGDVTGALDAGRALLPAALAVAPYFVAWRSHHRDEPLRRAVADRFPAARLLRERSGRTVWFRDALDGDGPRCDASQLRAIDFAIEIAGGTDRLRVVHLTSAGIEGSTLEASIFQPLADLGAIAAGAIGVDGPALAIPPVLDLVEYCERERFDRVLVTGVGPMAAAARVAAWCLELELVAALDGEAYERFRSVTGGLLPDSALASYLRWLYAPAREIRVADQAVGSVLRLAGVPAERLQVAVASTGGVLAAV